MAKQRAEKQPVPQPKKTPPIQERIPEPASATTPIKTAALQPTKKLEAAIPQAPEIKSKPPAVKQNAVATTPQPKSQPKSTTPIATPQPIAAPVNKASDNPSSKQFTPEPELVAVAAVKIAEPPAVPASRVKDAPELIVPVTAGQPASQLASQPANTLASEPDNLPGAQKPALSKPGVSKPGISKPGISKPGISKPGARKKTKRKPANKWALPVIGGLGAVCVLLGNPAVGRFHPNLLM
jgi:hypothetical protein